MENIKIGIIGCGNVSYSHIDSYLQLSHQNESQGRPKISVIAIADVLEEQVVKAQRHYANKGHIIPHTFSGEMGYKELLQLDLDGISICIPPNESKVCIVAEALRSRKIILIEKPLSYDLMSAEKMIAAWDRDSITMMCYNFRNSYIIQKFKQLIQEKTFGKLHSLNITRAEPWNYTIPESFYTKTGYLREHNVHDIDYLRFLNGEIVKISAVAYGEPDRLFKNPSSITLRYQFNDGVKGVFHSMNGTGDSQMFLQGAFDNGPVVGFQQGINPDFEWQDVPYFRILGPEGEIFAESMTRTADICKHKISWADVNRQGVSKGLSHYAIIEDFVGAITNEDDAGKSTIADGYQDMRVLDAIFKSLESNNGVSISIGPLMA